MGLSGGFAGGQLVASLFGGNTGASADSLYADAVNPMAGAMSFQRQAYQDEFDLQNIQANIALSEAADAAEAHAYDAEKFRKQQANAYNASGVLLEGSPMEVLNETTRLATKEVNAITRRGRATADVLRRRATATLNEGRSKLLGIESQFVTARSEAKIKSILARRSPISDALNGLGDTIGNQDLSSITNRLRKSAPATPGYNGAGIP